MFPYNLVGAADFLILLKGHRICYRTQHKWSVSSHLSVFSVTEIHFALRNSTGRHFIHLCVDRQPTSANIAW